MISFFFLNETTPTEIYTLSLHDALPISGLRQGHRSLARRLRGRRAGHLHAHRRHAGADTDAAARSARRRGRWPALDGDRKSTRLNSSHSSISYAVFCLKKKITLL